MWHDSPKLRNRLLFFGGLAGVLAQTVASLVTGAPEYPALLTLFGAMMGLPAFLSRGEDKMIAGRYRRFLPHYLVAVALVLLLVLWANGWQL